MSTATINDAIADVDARDHAVCVESLAGATTPQRRVSNMKDSIAYFGFKQVFKRTPR
ncbi:hypothetical protein [Salinisphaera japonica]|uniref:Uncharacterized protein n=1 Tax=Salinisphaera japonica YTM-1 TaxID=1209778 RepID=A0A423PWZ8_9GAMM|nr:hypothetical protein [Salinisphaera japonica]ROO30130.1 hypothetical protein SAJA_05325 [Salinisphaera japonica YTM-1]